MSRRLPNTRAVKSNSSPPTCWRPCSERKGRVSKLPFTNIPATDQRPPRSSRSWFFASGPSRSTTSVSGRVPLRRPPGRTSHTWTVASATLENCEEPVSRPSNPDLLLYPNRSRTKQLNRNLLPCRSTFLECPIGKTCLSDYAHLPMGSKRERNSAECGSARHNRQEGDVQTP